MYCLLLFEQLDPTLQFFCFYILTDAEVVSQTDVCIVVVVPQLVIMPLANNQLVFVLLTFGMMRLSVTMVSIVFVGVVLHLMGDVMNLQLDKYGVKSVIHHLHFCVVKCCVYTNAYLA